MTLIRQSVDSEELVRRTRADILRTSRTIGCWRSTARSWAAWRCTFIPRKTEAEIACLYVNKNHDGQGYGKKLMTFAEQLAAQRGMSEIFALSTQAFDYFQQKGGYTEAPPDVLPPARRESYETSGRNSKMLIKPVSQTPAAEPSRTAESQRCCHAEKGSARCFNSSFRFLHSSFSRA